MSIMQMLFAEFEQEAATTKRVLEAIPEDKINWRPHPKSMTLGQLGLHIAGVPGMLWQVQALDDFNPGEFQQPEAASRQDILDAFENSLKVLREEMPAMDDARAMSIWTMSKDGRVLLQLPRAAFVRAIMMNHIYHHRGQLSVYLRLLDVPVPSIYGPSADVNPFA